MEISAQNAYLWYSQVASSQTPPYFMTHWKTQKKFFLSRNSLLAYEETSKHLVVAGEPVTKSISELDQVFIDFLKFAKQKHKKVCGYYVGKEWKSAPFVKVPLGTSSVLPLCDFDIESSSSKEVRRALRKGKSLHYKVTLLDLNDTWSFQKLQVLFKKWKTKKLYWDLKFFLSRPQKNSFLKEHEKFYLLEKQGEPIAVCSLLPYFKNGREQFYVDHLIHDPFRDSHASSYLISYLMVELKRRGVEELNLGLNPFVMEEKKEHLMESLFAVLYKFPLWYRPQGLHQFKTKFPGIEEKEYCFFQKEINSWICLADMARLTLMGVRD